MVRTIVAGLLVCGLGVLAAAPLAHAQKVKNGGPSGTIQTGIGTAAVGGGVSGTILSAPVDKGFLIVTNFCSTDFVNGGVFLVSSTIGDLASVSNNGCLDFGTGIVVPAGDDLSCRNDGNSGIDTNCLVSGVLVRK